MADPARAIPIAKAAGRRRPLNPGARAIAMISLTVSALAACSENPGTADQTANAISENSGANAAPSRSPSPAAAPAEDSSPAAARVRALVSNVLGVPLSQVTDQARLIDDLGADSLDVIELVMGVEEEFGIEIPDVEAERLVTVGDFISYVVEHGG